MLRHIGIDIDGTCNNFHDTMVDVAIRYGKVHGWKVHIKNPDAYKLAEVMGWTDEQAERFLADMMDTCIQEAKPLKSLSAICRLLKREGRILHLITSRWESSKAITEKWLQDNDVPYDTLDMGVEDKLEKVAEYDIQAMIEDTPKHIKRVSVGGDVEVNGVMKAAPGIPVIVPQWPYNEGLKGNNIIPVKRDWNDVYGALYKTDKYITAAKDSIRRMMQATLNN